MRDLDDAFAFAIYKQAAQQIYQATVEESIDPLPEAARVLSFFESKIGTKAEHLCSFLELTEMPAGVHWKGDLHLARLWGLDVYNMQPM